MSVNELLVAMVLNDHRPAQVMVQRAIRDPERIVYVGLKTSGAGMDRVPVGVFRSALNRGYIEGEGGAFTLTESGRQLGQERIDAAEAAIAVGEWP